MERNIVFEQFKSINSLLDIISSRKNNKIFGSHKSSEKDDDTSFYGTKTYEEAKDLLKFGYKVVLKDIKKGIVKTNINYK